MTGYLLLSVRADRVCVCVCVYVVDSNYKGHQLPDYVRDTYYGKRPSHMHKHNRHVSVAIKKLVNGSCMQAYVYHSEIT